MCPFCKSQLKCKDNDRLLCKKCGRSYKIKDRIYDFADENWTWVEDSPEIKTLLKLTSSHGFAKAKMSLREKYEYVFSEKRADWLFHCFSLRKNRRCLDVGSGFGSTAFPLSRWYGEVWSLEKSPERIAFQRLRKKDEGKNVFLVRCDMLTHPFPDGSFDLVCLNGVLEWAGLGKPNENPCKTQLGLLSTVEKLLKDSGCLYIGIENRFGIQYFLGAKDHEGYRFTSILPRFVSNFFLRVFRGSRYLTYTYSYLEYKKLLRQAGFNYIDLYWVMPSYHYPLYSGKIEDINGFRFCLLMTKGKRKNNFLRKMVFGLMSLKAPARFAFQFFFPEFLIFAYKKRKQGTLEQSILRNIDAKSFFRHSGKDDTVYYYAIHKAGEEVCLVTILGNNDVVKNRTIVKRLISRNARAHLR